MKLRKKDFFNDEKRISELMQTLNSLLSVFLESPKCIGDLTSEVIAASTSQSPVWGGWWVVAALPALWRNG